MTDIEWIDPPTTAPAPVVVVAAQLRSRPGEWARIAKRCTIFNGWWTPLREQADYEVTLRTSEPRDGRLFGPIDVYARYLPGAPALAYDEPDQLRQDWIETYATRPVLPPAILGVPL